MSQENHNAFSSEVIEALTIDCVIFGFQDSKLKVLLVQHADGIIKDQWALHGGWVAYN